MKGAVVDVGSNSILLLVGESDGTSIHPISESSVVTGLGKNVKATGLISREASRSSLEALRIAFENAKANGAEFVAAKGTMVLRMAANADEFLSDADQQGTPMSVLSGKDEASLGFQAIVEDPAFSQFTDIVMIDPGGHSTELVISNHDGGRWQKSVQRSYSIGALGLLNSTLAAESPSGLDLIRATKEIDEIIGQSFELDPKSNAVTVGATGTNLVSIREQLSEWDPVRVHAAWLEYEEISKAAGYLSGLSLAERRGVTGLERGREDTILAGSLILERFLHAVRAEGCFVSVRGWRHALLNEIVRSKLASAGQDLRQ